MPLNDFHPAVARWFAATFSQPTPAQEQAWPAIRRGENVLIAAPTGSGKTLAAFLAAIDELVRAGVEGTLADETRVVYVSPLKALSNDVRINLEVPLEGIREELWKSGLPGSEIRTAVRTGDTPEVERRAMRKCPPHIVVTTPESLYILLGSDSGRAMLQTTCTVIVDEIHALVQSKRGSHLALTLERLDALCGRRCTRIGLSATQKPIEEVARFLVGTLDTNGTSPLPHHASCDGGEGWVRGQKPGSDATDTRDESAAPSPRPSPPTTKPSGERERSCTIIDAGHQRARDLGIELTNVPLQPVMSNDAWGLVYDRLAELIGQHRTTLIFSNTRRGVERATRHLAERLGKDAVAAHHGSLSKEKRLDAEQRLKHGKLRALVATASLELGIDIGEVDLVCQLSTPRSIAAFLQRAGRAGHAVDGVSKARLFPTSRDDLAECVALLDAVRRGELDTLHVPPAPLDVLAQQIVAEVACGERDEAALFKLFRRAYPYRTLTRERFNEVLRMLAEGYATRRGIRSAYLHRDAVNGRLRARLGARITALTSGGAIPDTADYDVVLEPQAIRVGSLNEDFAVESLAGDIFQLGNQSYRVLKIERGRVRVEDAQGAPPSIPFWLGEAPGRSDELSAAVARLRAQIATQLDSSPLPRTAPSFGGEGWVRGETPNAREDTHVDDTPRPLTPTLSPNTVGGEGAQAALSWLTGEVGIGENAARQLVDYYATARIELGLLPTQTTLAMERFFDEAGGMQLIIHSPYGSRLNRAWGLALRKRFCRSFNFELQAAATEDAIILSLSTSHSFPLEEVARYLHSNSVRDVLTQALLDAPMFALRFRWNAGAALALPRFQGGAKVPPQIQRMKSEDLLAAVFPDQVACLENIVGERRIPDHPLVAQTLEDCLGDAMDLAGLTALLKRLEAGEVQVVARDLTAPSVLAAEVLGSNPYTFLDDEGEVQNRRSQAASAFHGDDPRNARDLGILDADAIAAVREEAWPTPRDADEMHEALLVLGAVTGDDLLRAPTWQNLLDELKQAGRATTLHIHPPLPQTASSFGGEGRGEGEDPTNATTQEVSREPAAGDDAQTRACRCDRSPAGPAPSPNPLPHQKQMGERATFSHSTWVAAEMLPMWQAVHPDASWQPTIAVPAEFTSRDWTREDALVEVLRTRLACMGVTDAAALANALRVPVRDIEIALAALEREGTAMRGQFESRPSTHEPAPGCVGGPAPSDADPASAARPGRDRLPDARGGACPGLDPGTPDASVQDEQWCDRHLLARIHRRTVQRLRREIEPVAPRDFMRFLLDWQHVAPSAKLRGPDALAAVLAQLKGFEAAAGAWEAHVLPARVAGYDIAWLDALCGAGRIAWARLRAASGSTHASPVRASPIVLLPRRELAAWNAIAAQDDDAPSALSSRAQAVADFLAQHGASFFGEIAEGTRLLKVELEDALGELVAAGRVGADSFAGLRALLQPASKRRHPRQRRMARHLLTGIEDAGRWSLVRQPSRSTDAPALQRDATSTHAPEYGAAAPFGSASREGSGEPGPSPLPLSHRERGFESEPLRSAFGASRRLSPGETGTTGEAVEHIARTLLRRWGVVFWKLLEREAAWLPPWRELRRAYQRLEARGEIRGGRFVEGMVGEQFALPEAVEALRRVRKREPDGALIVVSGVDPLNLIGTVLPGARVPALTSSRIVYRDGLPLATRVAREITLLQPLAMQEANLVRGLLRRNADAHPSSPIPAAYP